MMDSQFDSETLQRIERCAVLAVLVLDDAASAVPLARALVAGGVDAMELTLRTSAAIDALVAVRREVPEMLCGIGTILTPDQVHAVREAGAAFGVSPGVNPRVIREAQKVGLPFAPGVVTPSDVEAALELGRRELKFFPAEPSGGIGYLKSLAAPYAHLGVRFVPLGGVSTKNLAAYLAEPLVLAVGGSWLAPRDLIAAADWPAITARAEEASRIAREARPHHTS
jgi:2-dehydro-3-deoxyphosphogluconate aldolase / (4S)-4-hydroxy-2-oxoglutarate aldolase